MKVRTLDCLLGTSKNFKFVNFLRIFFRLLIHTKGVVSSKDCIKSPGCVVKSLLTVLQKINSVNRMQCRHGRIQMWKFFSLLNSMSCTVFCTCLLNWLLSFTYLHRSIYVCTTTFSSYYYMAQEQNWVDREVTLCTERFIRDTPGLHSVLRVKLWSSRKFNHYNNTILVCGVYDLLISALPDLSWHRMRGHLVNDERQHFVVILLFPYG